MFAVDHWYAFLAAGLVLLAYAVWRLVKRVHNFFNMEIPVGPQVQKESMAPYLCGIAFQIMAALTGILLILIALAGFVTGLIKA